MSTLRQDETGGKRGTGVGVLETLNAAARLLLAKYSKTPNANVTGLAKSNDAVVVPPPAEDAQVQAGNVA